MEFFPVANDDDIPVSDAVLVIVTAAHTSVTNFLKKRKKTSQIAYNSQLSFMVLLRVYKIEST